MEYACPVCETPQQDAEHLANHLAFTAMLHGDAHETWLNDHVPGWAEAGAADLAPVVADHADEATYEAVFEDTVHDDDHDHHHEADRPPVDGAGAGGAPAALDKDARSALATAREMTRAMLDEGGDGDDDTDNDRKA
ncbi:DUF5810 domain-containing protein [Haloplanus sp.]|uniref:DUF5810 domain-containing protein n=1 Tax=Haloplanus sp. TaxID=1961696 RepID=UPI0026213515|nr:DUF5810 domain-containing protein [Haloplanus sp.]